MPSLCIFISWSSCVVRSFGLQLYISFIFTKTLCFFVYLYVVVCTSCCFGYVVLSFVLIVFCLSLVRSVVRLFYLLVVVVRSCVRLYVLISFVRSVARSLVRYVVHCVVCSRVCYFAHSSFQYYCRYCCRVCFRVCCCISVCLYFFPESISLFHYSWRYGIRYACLSVFLSVRSLYFASVRSIGLVFVRYVSSRVHALSRPLVLSCFVIDSRFSFGPSLAYLYDFISVI